MLIIYNYIYMKMYFYCYCFHHNLSSFIIIIYHSSQFNHKYITYCPWQTAIIHFFFFPFHNDDPKTDKFSNPDWVSHYSNTSEHNKYDCFYYQSLIAGIQFARVRKILVVFIKPDKLYRFLNINFHNLALSIGLATKSFRFFPLHDISRSSPLQTSDSIWYLTADVS